MATGAGLQLTQDLHHKLCHTLGGTLNLPHAETHTVVLPHVLAFNAPALDPVVLSPTEALGVPDDKQPGTTLRDLAAELGAPTTLASLGAERDALPGITHRGRCQPPTATPATPPRTTSPPCSTAPGPATTPIVIVG